MTREEAIERFNGIINAMSISIAQSKFYPSKTELDELCDMAIEALSADRPQREWKHTITWQPYCSNCEYVFGEDEEFSPFWNYCPMCGARIIESLSANCTTEKPNDIVDSKNDVVAEPTDLISREYKTSIDYTHHDSLTTDFISRSDTIDAVKNLQTEQWIDSDTDYNNGLQSAIAEIRALPSADRPTELLDDGTLKVNVKSGAEVNRVLIWGDDGCGGLYYADDRPSGEWVEKEVMVDEDANITEWQSAKCSACGKYHTTPYMYYFDNFNYCPNCGAKMGSD